MKKIPGKATIGPRRLPTNTSVFVCPKDSFKVVSLDNSLELSFETSLKESLGHTKKEVLVGGFLGPIVALPGIFFIGSPLHILQMMGLFSV